MGQAMVFEHSWQEDVLSPLGVTLHAVCQSTGLSPHLCLPPCLAWLPLAGPGAQPPLLPPEHKEAAQRIQVSVEEEEGARVQHPSSTSKGAEPREHRQNCTAQQRPRGKGGLADSTVCVLHGPHSWKQGKRGKRPLQSQQSRLFIPCLFTLSDLNA